MGGKWYLIVVLPYISLMINDGNHILVYFFHLCTIFGELSISLFIFLIGLFHFTFFVEL